MMSILVLDDQAADRELLSALLSHGGHAVPEASDGEQAPGLARSSRPELIVCDLLMPGMDGYEFVRRLRADPAVAATRVLFCTANYDAEEVAAAGFDGYMPTPINPGGFFAELDHFLAAPDAVKASGGDR